MGIFSDVNPGDAWKPEPAERYNAVNRLLTATGAGGAGEAPRLPANRGALIVPAANPAGRAAIPAFTPVALAGNAIKQNPGDPADAIFEIAGVASGGAVVWGVTQSPCSGGNIVGVLLQGLTAVFAAGAVAAGDTLVPASGGVMSGAGAARALTTITSGGVILAQLGAAAESPEYSGYFKLTLNSNASGAAITIADGATSGASIAVVNGGSTYSLPPYTAPVSGETVYFLQYNPARYDSGGQLVSGATMAISSVAGGTLPSGGTSGAYYMQLGRVVGSGAELRAVQDHTAGVAAFNWFVQCNPYTLGS